MVSDAPAPVRESFPRAAQRLAISPGPDNSTSRYHGLLDKGGCVPRMCLSTIPSEISETSSHAVSVVPNAACRSLSRRTATCGEAIASHAVAVACGNEELHHRRCNDPERSFSADEKLFQVVVVATADAQPSTSPWAAPPPALFLRVGRRFPPIWRL